MITAINNTITWANNIDKVFVITAVEELGLSKSSYAITIQSSNASLHKFDPKPAVLPEMDRKGRLVHMVQYE